MSNIKLIALDLDNTLIGQNLTISTTVQAAIAQAKAKGVRITIATGRNPLITARYARQLGLTTPIIAYQGGIIADPTTGDELRSARLAADIIPDALAFAGQHRLSMQFEESGTIYIANRHPIAQEFAGLMSNAHVVHIDSPAELPAIPHKFLVSMLQRHQRPTIRDAMRAHFDGRLTITPSHPLVVEGLPPGTSKGNALAWLAQHLGIPRENVMAMGDNDNDISMLTWAGLGITLRDGSPAAHAAADWIAPSIEEDGVAAALSKFVL